MSSFERLCSRRDARRISFSFRFHRLSGLRKKFFTTCWVMVLAPSRLRPLSASTAAARKRAKKLKPGCL